MAIFFAFSFDPNRVSHGWIRGLRTLTASACVLAHWSAFGTEPDDSEAELADLDGELSALLEESPWQWGVDVDVASGYRHNPTLAAFGRVSSVATRANLSAFAWRMPLEGAREWLTLFDGTWTHHHAEQVDDSSLAIVRSELRSPLGRASEASVAVRWIHHDEIVDATSLDNPPTAEGAPSVRARLSSPGVSVGVESGFGPWTLEGGVGVDYSDFRSPLDDLWTVTGEIDCSRATGRASRVGLEASAAWRLYETREQSAIGGRPLPFTRLRTVRPGVEIYHELVGGGDSGWKTRARAGFRTNLDNGSGWHDYDQSYAGVAFAMERARWSLDVDLDRRDTLYRHQTYGFGNPPRRRHEQWSLALRLERSFGSAWSVFFDGEVSLDRSNDPFLHYDDRLLLAGVRWSR
ncbi:hypothetical protein ASA1KI_41850 [Opitutales bacterium ASA1]|uniref:hypothetical protein n=1 Tax=Congregicoccus parvus TaxID=3081749 RepID=UPI002B293169|nr:hypothetical protein ASA1KI_41850 [Opitutales bacterium ASA1]